MKTSSRDKSSSLVFALITFFGIGVILLGGLFMMRLPQSADLPPHSIEAVEGTLNPPGVARDDKPLQDEADIVDTENLADALSLVNQHVTAAIGIGGGEFGLGDSRSPGIPGEGTPQVPAFKRWELKFSARDLNGYAKTLDHFKIELAAVGGGEPLVAYAREFSTTPATRKAAGDQEKRLYFMYRNEGALLRYDRQLLSKAGIETDNRIVLKFIPTELQDQLLNLELEYAKKNRGPETTSSEIAKTIYDCQSVGNQGFQWVVISQHYRKPPVSTTARSNDQILDMLDNR